MINNNNINNNIIKNNNNNNNILSSDIDELISNIKQFKLPTETEILEICIKVK